MHNEPHQIFIFQYIGKSEASTKIFIYIYIYIYSRLHYINIMDADPFVVGQNAGFEGRLKIYKDILLYHSLINIYYTKKH